MNKTFILDHLGYVVGVDFEERHDTGFTWLSDTVAEPSDQVLQENWDQYLIDLAPILLEEDRVAALKYADGLSGEKRAEFVSVGVGQDFVYQEKTKQAQEFKDGGYVNPGNFLFIIKEANALNKNPREIADTILTNRNNWIAKSSDIEQLKLAAKQDIRNAIEREEIADRLDKLQTDLDAL